MKRLIASTWRSIGTPTAGGDAAKPILGPLAGLRLDPHFDLSISLEEPKPEQRAAFGLVDRRFAAVDLELQPLDERRDALHDSLPRSLARM